MRPALLRPPFCFRPSVSPLTGLPFHNSPRSTATWCRCDGGGGLKGLSAIRLDPSRHVDTRALGQRDDRLFVIGAAADAAAEPLRLALHPDRVDGVDLDVEQTLDRGLDLTLIGVERYPEDDLVVLGSRGRLLGDHRGADDVVHLLPGELGLGRWDDPKAAHFSPFISGVPPAVARRRGSAPADRGAGCRRHWRPAAAARRPLANC